MRIAAHGMISDSAGSSAGAFCGLLRTLLEQGHEVTFFGVKNFTEPKSLERYERYRFHRLTLNWKRFVRPWVLKLRSRYAESTLSVLTHIAFQERAIAEIEDAPEPYDFVLCLDVPNLWRSRIPVLSWPQAPPHTEWAALRRPHIARSMVRGEGALYYGAVQLFYAWRWAQGRAALRASDIVLCGSPWARDEWIKFGLEPERAELLAYPIDVPSFAHLPPPVAPAGEVTFLWLGRSVPRKRMDLFLAGFELVQRRLPAARALLIGQFEGDRDALALLERYRGRPGITISAPIPRAEVPKLFGEVHVLAQPSENENFGFSVAEALAAGRPVVAGPTNGTAAFGGDALYAFERYEPEDVANAMERAARAVLSDPAGVAAVARRAARQSFDAERVASRVCEVARRAIAMRAARDARGVLRAG